MSPFELVALVLSITALFAYVNYRWVRLPPTIGLTAIALASSLLMLALGKAEVINLSGVTSFVNAIDFDQTLLNGILGALLFAGALHVDLDEMREQKLLIAVLSTVGVALSTVLVGIAAWVVTRALGIPLPLIWSLVFGALISPTDPIAVGAILRRAGVPKRLEVTITGESLFNDGIGVVVFLVLLGIAGGGEKVTAGAVARLFLLEAIGGCVFGAIAGWITNRMLSKVDHYQTEILLTLALTTGGFMLANRLHVSGALAMVVAGLMVGSSGRAFAMSPITQQRLDEFWELVDEFLNAVLFVMIGVDVIIVEFGTPSLIAGLLAIPLVIAARYCSAGIPLFIMRRIRPLMPGTLRILTWSGLRGGISVALVLSLPASDYRATLLAITYVVVCFSILVQGLTVERVVAHVIRRSQPRKHQAGELPAVRAHTSIHGT